MKILFVHPNLPGQYKHLARILAQDPKNQVVFACNPTDKTVPNVVKAQYKATSGPSPQTHRYIIGLDRGIRAGQALWRVCQHLKSQGFIPDIVIAHPGWGDCLFVKDAFPDTPLLSFFEFYYHAFGADVYFDEKDEINPDDVARIRVKNATNLFNLEACDWGISPTKWQFSLHPDEYKYKMSVIHDGIDTDAAKPRDVKKTVTLPNGTTLSADDEIVTYVARNFEPYRGFDTFMQFVEIITKERPNCHILIAGNDGVSYGRQIPEGGKTYKQQMLDKVNFDESRVHWLGTLAYEDYLKVLAYSKAHIYLTVPFVLSWSMMEAMSAGCLLIASNTHPVTEVLEEGKTGFLVDFFSPDDLAKRVNDVLDNQEKYKPIRAAARQKILDEYSLKLLIPRHIELINDLVQGNKPKHHIDPSDPMYHYDATVPERAKGVFDIIEKKDDDNSANNNKTKTSGKKNKKAAKSKKKKVS